LIPLRDNIRPKSFPFITWFLIALNFYFFSIQLKIRNDIALESFIRGWAVIPRELWSNPTGYGYTLITATFLHGGWLHIISNMLFLHIFGDNVEDRMGHARFTIFYILCAILANGSQAFFSPASGVPLIGASGAIAGVLGAYFFYFPHAKVDTLIPIFFFITIRPLPAFIFLGYWFLLQAISSTYSMTAMATGQSMGGIAFMAHASGFVSGLLLGPAFAPRKRRYR
jgi:membrane associated rhomboid family serine protease